MDINRNNYEAYLLDMMEGRLTAKEQQMVRDFLSLNPDLQTEPGMRIDESQLWTLEKETISFKAKDGLKKEIPHEGSELKANNFDLFSIARIEGDLTPGQEEAHQSMMAGNKALEEEWSVWQKSKLAAEPVVFVNKSSLKKQAWLRSRIIWIGVLSSAAAIALVFMLLRLDPGLAEPELTEQTNQPEESFPVDQSRQTELASEPSAPVPTENPKVRTDQPATLSIRKHQNPPELKEKGNGDKIDSVKNKVNTQKTKPRSIRIASLNDQPIPEVERGSYDQISSLQLPPSPVHLTSLSIAQIADLEIQEMVETYAEESEFSIWTLASAGIKGINRITGGDMDLVASRDEDGALEGLRFKSRLLSVDRPIVIAE